MAVGARPRRAFGYRRGVRQAAATGDLDIGLVLSNAGAMNAPGWQRHASEPLAEVLVNDKQEIR
jgi:hypothetical protein